MDHDASISSVDPRVNCTQVNCQICREQAQQWAQIVEGDSGNLLETHTTSRFVLAKPATKKPSAASQESTSPAAQPRNIFDPQLLNNPRPRTRKSVPRAHQSVHRVRMPLECGIMEIYLVQHGAAKTEAENPQRSLTEGGMRTVERMGEHLAALALALDRIEHSDKLRARQTAEILAAKLRPANGTVQVPGLLPMMMSSRLACGSMKKPGTSC